MTLRSLVAALVLPLLCLGCAGVSEAEGVSLVAVGNSITHHGPAPAINWHGNWGMAATSPSTDYVGHLARLMMEHSTQSPRVRRFSQTALESRPREATLDRELLAAARASSLLVVELGDNVSPATLADFGVAYAKLLGEGRPAKGMLICLSTWWNSPAIDALIKPACERASGTFVFIGDIHAQPGRTGSRDQGLTDPGVLSHPGDAGMAEIASRAFAAWRSQALRQPQ